MYLEYKKELEQLVSEYEVMNNNIDKYFEEIKTELKKSVKDLYGYEITNSLVDAKTWSNSIMFRISENGGYRDLKLEIQFGEYYDMDVKNINLNSNEDLLTLTGMLVLDFKGKKGVFSVGEMMTKKYFEMAKLRKEKSRKMSEVSSIVRKYETENKMERMFEIVKSGYVIELGYNHTYNVTKITDKCVFVVDVDGGEVKGRRLKKEEFYNTVRDHIDLTEVE
jgi:hypothetical protein